MKKILYCDELGWVFVAGFGSLDIVFCKFMPEFSEGVLQLSTKNGLYSDHNHFSGSPEVE